MATIGYGLQPATLTPVGSANGASFDAAAAAPIPGQRGLATVKEILTLVGQNLSDPDHIRWPLQVLASFIDAGIRECQLYKPDSFAFTAEFVCSPGARQTLAGGFTHLIRIVRNLHSLTNSENGDRIGGRNISLVDRESLDAINPYWTDPERGGAALEVAHAFYDPGQPVDFMVYPCNTGGGIIEIEVSPLQTPVALDMTTDNPPVAKAVIDQTGSVCASVIFTNALADYVCFKAFQSDDEVPNSAQRAVAHYTAFANAIGIKVQTERKRNPDTKYQASAGEDNR